jgi:hypothetical protein
LPSTFGRLTGRLLVLRGRLSKVSIKERKDEAEQWNREEVAGGPRPRTRSVQPNGYEAHYSIILRHPGRSGDEAIGSAERASTSRTAGHAPAFLLRTAFRQREGPNTCGSRFGVDAPRAGSARCVCQDAVDGAARRRRVQGRARRPVRDSTEDGRLSRRSSTQRPSPLRGFRDGTPGRDPTPARPTPVAQSRTTLTSTRREVSVVAVRKPGLVPETRRTGGGPAVQASPPLVGSSAGPVPALLEVGLSQTHGDRGAGRCAAWSLRRPRHEGGRSRAPA